MPTRSPTGTLCRIVATAVSSVVACAVAARSYPARGICDTGRTSTRMVPESHRMCILARKTLPKLALAAALAFAGCASVPAGWRAEPSGEVTYLPLNLRFPERFEDLERVGVLTFDGQGQNVAVGYSKEAEKLALTLYFYLRPQGETPEDHFKATLKTIVDAHPGARVEFANFSNLRIGDRDRKVPGFIALMLFKDEGTDVGSYLWIIPAGDRFVKLRTSIRRGRDPETDKQILTRAALVSQRLLGTLPLAAAP